MTPNRRKAWATFVEFPMDGALLVYAETRNKARWIAAKNGTWEWEYADIKAVRVKEYDKYYSGVSVIEDNDELPEEAPAFYYQGEFY